MEFRLTSIMVVIGYNLYDLNINPGAHHVGCCIYS
ncbi:hypothetical protein Mooltan_164 [Salmonella phage Mooltan]|nr:hypothetical protein Mooltan_164 [Salmonella phage Mooltan]